MPKWIHDRAERLMPKMKGQYGEEKGKQVAFAVATQMGHATGKSPKTFVSKQTKHKERFGTSEGRVVAKAKFDRLKSQYQKTAMFRGFTDELSSILKTSVSKGSLASRGVRNVLQRLRRGVPAPTMSASASVRVPPKAPRPSPLPRPSVSQGGPGSTL